MRRILLFLGLAFALSAPWWWLIRHEHAGAYTAILMWCPAAAAALAKRYAGGGVGWRPASARYVVGGAAVTAGVLALVHLPLFATGVVSWDAHALAERATSLGLSGAPRGVIILVAALVLATSGMVRLAGPALGEEVGWRGWLVPEACGRLGYARGSLLTGVAWFAWHLPLLFGNATPAGMVNFAVMIVGMSFTYSWFRLRSGSVWPTTVMHALHNALVPSLFVKLAATGPAADRWLDETGDALGVMGIVLVIAFLFIQQRVPASASAA
jgi:membrane protease YdiL (CAAX protease family)